MLDLSTVQRETFVPLIGDTFVVKADQDVELVLSSATRRGDPVPGFTREQFSLDFTGPAGLLLPQQMWVFTHPTLGEMEIFITQTKGGAQGSQFEAAFS